ncbi:hypothetical protein TRVA0_011S00958 [Trichomonascus vanleenenianus]|uniref:DUF202 domain-containing protein n=1 Tax=Trichomonascus vanleenenianus TaxID=2268995 RepID=UPI003ECB06DC
MNDVAVSPKHRDSSCRLEPPESSQRPEDTPENGGEGSSHELLEYNEEEPSHDNRPKDDHPVPYTDDRDVEASTQAAEVDEDEDVTDDETLQSSVDRPAQSLNLYGVSDWQFFMANPVYTDIVYENNTSESRDLDAAERNFLSMLRTSVYIGLAGMVVLLNYRLPSHGSAEPQKPPKLDSKVISLTLGSIFLVLCLGSLVATLGYVHIVTGYAKQRSLVHNRSTTLVIVILSALTVLAANIIYLIQD